MGVLYRVPPGFVNLFLRAVLAGWQCRFQPRICAVGFHVQRREQRGNRVDGRSDQARSMSPVCVLLSGWGRGVENRPVSWGKSSARS